MTVCRENVKNVGKLDTVLLIAGLTRNVGGAANLDILA